jgi:hypothetical protein
LLLPQVSAKIGHSFDKTKAQVLIPTESNSRNPKTPLPPQPQQLFTELSTPTSACLRLVPTPTLPLNASTFSPTLPTPTCGVLVRRHSTARHTKLYAAFHPLSYSSFDSPQ